MTLYERSTINKTNIEKQIHYFMREVPLSETFEATLLDAIAGLKKEIVMLNEKNDHLETKILLMKQELQDINAYYADLERLAT